MGGPLPGSISRVSTAPPAEGRVELALAPALRMRLLGAGLLAVGVLTAVAAALAALLPGTRGIVGGLLVLALVAVLTLGLLLGVRRWVVRLDEVGYRVRLLRSAEARSARWTDVLDLQTAQISGTRCAVLRLRDGRTSAIPVDVLEGDPEAFVQLLTARLDRGHGYRRLR